MRKKQSTSALKFTALCCMVILSLSFHNSAMTAGSKTDRELNEDGILLVADDAQASTSAKEAVSWREKFERICSQTAIATSLSTAQLSKLVRESNELLDQLALIEEPAAKIYVFRLKKCRDLFQFTLEWHQK